MRFVPSLTRTHGSHKFYATVAGKTLRPPQTIIEKVVQKYAVGLPEGKVVKAGDYVMIRPEHVMTHDNTGPVISKSVDLKAFSLQKCSSIIIDSSPLVH